MPLLPVPSTLPMFSFNNTGGNNPMQPLMGGMGQTNNTNYLGRQLLGIPLAAEHRSFFPDTRPRLKTHDMFGRRLK